MGRFRAGRVRCAGGLPRSALLEVAVDDMPLRGFDLLPRLMPDPIVTSIRKSEIRVPGLRLRSVVAVMAWMAAPKGSVKARTTRRREPEKVFMVLCGHESARRGAVHCLSTVFQRYRNSASPNSRSRVTGSRSRTATGEAAAETPTTAATAVEKGPQ